MKRPSKSSLRWMLISIMTILPVCFALAETQPIPINVGAGPAAQTSTTRIHQGDFHVTEDVTTLVTDEMRLHMDSARLADSSKDFKAAADELKRVQAHVQSQLTALQHANDSLTRLITDTQNGKVPPADLDLVFTQIRHATNRMQVWVPVTSDEVDVFMPEMAYHLSRAKQEWQGGQSMIAAKDVRIAVAYLRLRQEALPANKTNRREALQKAEKSLSRVAAKIQNDERLSANKMDAAFSKATAAWDGSF